MTNNTTNNNDIDNDSSICDLRKNKDMNNENKRYFGDAISALPFITSSVRPSLSITIHSL